MAEFSDFVIVFQLHLCNRSYKQRHTHKVKDENEIFDN